MPTPKKQTPLAAARVYKDDADRIQIMRRQLGLPSQWDVIRRALDLLEKAPKKLQQVGA